MTRETQEEAEVEGIDVVIPVFGAAADLARCLSSVVEHTDLPPHRLTFVADGPQGSDVEEVLSKVPGHDPPGVRVLRNEKRRGFVASVNRGMEACSRDVVLLNSDTIVTSGWLERLRAAAYSAPHIATVTPLSNSATICSLPEFLEDNLIPEGVSIDEIGEITTAVSRFEYPRLPTGVGVCLYIRREAIDVVGFFDDKRFGFGYGEENEFCIRATRAGFEHLADDATFIFHAGQGSFGTSSVERQKRAMRRLRRVDRSYVSMVASFIRRDPLRPVRDRIIERVLERSRPPNNGASERRLSILHVVHGWPPFDVGGTEQYARHLALHQLRRHDVSACAKVANQRRASGQRQAYLDRGIRVRLLVNNFDQRNPLARNAMKNGVLDRQFGSFVDEVAPDLVHVHHLAGLSASLVSVARKRRIKIVYQVQDWWAACARSNLWHVEGRLCRGPSAARCTQCLPMTARVPKGILNRLLYRFRARYIRKQLQSADAYVMGSETVNSWYSGAGLFKQGVPAFVLEYGAEIPRSASRARSITNVPLRFGIIAALMPHKGVHVAVEAFRDISPDDARLHVWGDTEVLPEYTEKVLALAPPNVVELHGRFDEEDKAGILASIDVLIVPSVGLESYGIVAREAMACGVPVIASRRGALGELEIEGSCGALVEPEDPEDIRDWVKRLARNPEIVDGWRIALPEIPGIEEHAAAVEDIYTQILGDRS